MLRLLLLTGAILLTADYSFAQGASPTQCQQVKEAVARYGYAAARQYALAHYGPEAVRAGDQCFAKHYGTHYEGHYPKTSRTHFWRHYKKYSR
jgi:hypothetical protein